MVTTYDIGIKHLSNTLRLEISEEFITRHERIELPLQKFEGHEGYEWQLLIACSKDGVRFEKKPIRRTWALQLDATIEGTNLNFALTRYYDSLCYVDPPYIPPTFTLEQLQKGNAFKDGKFTMIIKATCCIPYSSPLPLLNSESVLKVATKMFLNVGQCFTKDPDFTFLFDDDQSLSVHKECFTNWSPVFKAMLEHDTQEARNGTLEIKDFDYDTVKDAVDLLYGRPFDPKPINQVVGMLLFTEKYLIKPAVDLLEDWLITHVTEDDFDAVVKYAFEHDSKKLKAICAHCYYKHLKPGLRDIDLAVISELAHLAANQASRRLIIHQACLGPLQ